MSVSSQDLSWIMGGGAMVVALLLVFAFGGDHEGAFVRRLSRVTGHVLRRASQQDRPQNAMRRTTDSDIAVVDRLVKMLPNPDRLRQRLARTGHEWPLGEYLLVNLLVGGVFFLLLYFFGVAKLVCVLVGAMLGVGVPHMVTGMLGNQRVKKFLTSFPEAIDTMCRGLRSGLPATESISAVAREIPGPIGIEFNRISDGVRLGRSLEDAMWEVAYRINAPEFRFLIIAMAIQKETGGNLAETLGNLSDLIRRRRQLKQKVKAMSSEAIASAGIIGSLPFIMFLLLWFVSREYITSMFESRKGEYMLGGAIFWLSLGWAIMLKMINFEL